jgi:hypothetical protein
MDTIRIFVGFADGKPRGLFTSWELLHSPLQRGCWDECLESIVVPLKGWKDGSINCDNYREYEVCESI